MHGGTEEGSGGLNSGFLAGGNPLGITNVGESQDRAEAAPLRKKSITGCNIFWNN
jgi:hypothetical protein